MLAAEDPHVTAELLLLSYPLHPPAKPELLRTAHWPNLRTPALFIHGDADPFGTVAEMQAALTSVGGPHRLSIIEGTGHDLKRGKFDLSAKVLLPFAEIAT